MPQTFALHNQWPTSSDYEWYTSGGDRWHTPSDYAWPRPGDDGWYTPGDYARPRPSDDGRYTPVTTGGTHRATTGGPLYPGQ